MADDAAASPGLRKRESHFRFNRRRTRRRIGIRDLEHTHSVRAPLQQSAEKKDTISAAAAGEAHAIILQRALCRDAGAHSLGEIIYQRERERAPAGSAASAAAQIREREGAPPRAALTHKVLLSLQN